MIPDDTWFTEVCEDAGSAYSLKIKGKLHDEQTPYQRIEIYQTQKYGNLMTIDGLVMLSTRDNFIYHEMLSHPVLFTHSDPKDVLIVGGGDCGTLLEVLKHKNIASVQQVEIDERVTRVAEQYFPELCASNQDSRAEFIFEDAINWVRDSKQARYDVIIVDSTDPVGPAQGLFTATFFRNCLRVLRPNGIIVQQSESPLIHGHIIKSMYLAMREAGFNNIQSLLFPQSVYPSGWWSATMATKNELLCEFREEDAVNKTFDSRYYNRDVHRGALNYPEFFSDYISTSTL